MTDSSYTTTLIWFALGFILQAILYLKNKTNLLGFLILVIVVSVPSYIASLDDTVTNPRAFIFIFLIFFFPTYFFAFKTYVLPNINELTLLLYTIFFWYFTLTTTNDVLKWLMIYLALIPTLVTGLFALFPKTPNTFMQIIGYVWYLVITSFLFFFQLNTKPLSYLLGGQSIITVPPTEIFLSGMVFFILSIKITSLLYLIPLTSKHQTFANRIQNIRKYLHLLSIKYRDTQLIPFQALIITGGVSLIIWLNYQYKLISDTILLNSLIILIPFLAKEYENPALKMK